VTIGDGSGIRKIQPEVEKKIQPMVEAPSPKLQASSFKLDKLQAVGYNRIC